MLAVRDLARGKIGTAVLNEQIRQAQRTDQDAEHDQREHQSLGAWGRKAWLRGHGDMVLSR